MPMRRRKTTCRTSRSRRLLPAAIALLLSACAEDGNGALFGRTAEPLETPKAGIQQVDLGTAAKAVEARETREAALTAPPVDDDPQRLVGLGPASIAERLGSPAFVRRDGPAEVWQYAADACVLDVFLYRDGNAFKVSYVTLRGRGAADLSRRACYAGMLRAQAAQPRG